MERVKIDIQKDPTISSIYKLLNCLTIEENVKVYQALNKQNSQIVTLKVQIISHFHQEKSLIQKQYSLFNKLKGYPGIPTVYRKGQWDNGYFMEMQCLKKNLCYLTQCCSKLNIKEILYVFSKIIRIIAIFHEIGFCISNISPENFYIALDKKIYLMKCSDATPIEQNFLNISDFNNKRKLNPKQSYYSSLRSLKGKKGTYADDIESAFYVLCHFYYKQLPWSDRNKSVQRIIQEKSIFAEQMIQKIGKNYLTGFRYIKSIKYKTKPNYQYLIRNWQQKKYQNNPIIRSRSSISTYKIEFQDEPRILTSSISIGQQISIENQTEVIKLNAKVGDLNTSISSIVINRVSQKTISSCSLTLQTSSKALLGFFEDVIAEKQNYLDQNLDLDIEPPKIPMISTLKVRASPHF